MERTCCHHKAAIARTKVAIKTLARDEVVAVFVFDWIFRDRPVAHRTHTKLLGYWELALVPAHELLSIDCWRLEEVEAEIAEALTSFTTINVCPLHSKVQARLFVVKASTVVLRTPYWVGAKRDINILHCGHPTVEQRVLVRRWVNEHVLQEHEVCVITKAPRVDHLLDLEAKRIAVGLTLRNATFVIVEICVLVYREHILFRNERWPFRIIRLETLLYAIDVKTVVVIKPDSVVW